MAKRNTVRNRGVRVGGGGGRPRANWWKQALGVDYYSQGGEVRSFSGYTQPQVILEVSGSGDETVSLRNNDVVELDTDTWAMMYSARNGTGRLGIKYATAAKGDLLNWTKQNGDGEFVIQAGEAATWDDQIGGCTVLKEGSTYHFMYDGTDSGQIGYASGTSLDNIVKQNGGNPVIDNTQLSTFDKYVRHPFLIKKDDTYYCFYDARPQSPYLLPHRIGLSTSTDLINWTRAEDFVIQGSDYPDSWFDSLADPTIIKIGVYYFMVCGAGLDNKVGDGGDLILMAGGVLFRSTDLLTWELITSRLPLDFYASNGVGIGVGEPCMFQEGSKYYIAGSTNVNGKPGLTIAELTPGDFDDTYPDALDIDSFDGTVIDTDKYTPASNGNGITISQNDKLIITSDGSVTAAVKAVNGIDYYDTEERFQIIFDLERTQVSGGATTVGMTGNADGYSFGIERGDATKIRLFYSLNSVKTTTDITRNYTGTYKISYKTSEIAFFVWNTSTSKWDYLWHATSANFSNRQMRFIMQQANLLSSAVTTSVDNLIISRISTKMRNPYV